MPLVPIDEIRKQLECKLDKIMFADGSGTLDCVLSHGRLKRIALFFFGRWMNRKTLSVNNAASFQRGDILEFYSPLGTRREGAATVAKKKIIRRGWLIECFEIVPRKLRRGWLIVKTRGFHVPPS